MAAFIKVATRMHRLAIAGRVIDDVTGAPVEGAVATVTAMPAAFRDQLAIGATASGTAWDALPERADRTRAARDGCFRFVNLPDGAYRVSVAGPASGRYGAAQADFKVDGKTQGRAKNP